MIGLGMLGEKFHFIKRTRFRAIFHVVPAVVFVIRHTTHAVLYQQQMFA